MPLRDHFHSPLSDRRSWDELHGQWPAMIVLGLVHHLPRRYVAAPTVHLGASAEIDVSTFEEDDSDILSSNPGNGNGGVATAVWAPGRATLTVATDLPAPEEYEVRVYDMKRGRRLVAAVELVSPANKDRPEHRRAFVAKCAALLQQQVSVTVVDVVTVRDFNLFQELLEFIGSTDGPSVPAPPPLYGVACRATRKGQQWLLEAWVEALTVGRSLPTLPLWLADNLAVPLNLEESYEETCRVLRVP